MSEHVSNEVVTSPASAQPKKFTKKGMLVSLAGVIVLIGAIVISLVLHHHHNHKLAVASVQINSTLQQSNKSVVSGDTSAAISLLKQQIAVTSNPTQKLRLINQLATVYANLPDVKDAVTTYDQALQYTANKGSIYSSIAQLYEASNDKSDAIKYYNLAIQKWSTDDPLRQSEIQSIQSEINSLQGQS